MCRVCFKRLCHLQGAQGPSGPPGDKGIAGESVSISSSENLHNYWGGKKISDFVALHFRFSHAEFSRYRNPQTDLGRSHGVLLSLMSSGYFDTCFLLHINFHSDTFLCIPSSKTHILNRKAPNNLILFLLFCPSFRHRQQSSETETI